MTTADSHDRDVDALPTIPVKGAAPSAVPLLVRLRPGAVLTHNISWLALRIPAPAPIFRDDAGHRFVPKTTAFPLSAGEYTVSVELPLYGLTRDERKVSTRVRVAVTDLPGKGGGDGGH